MRDETHRAVLAASRLELRSQHRKEQARLEHAIKVRNKRIAELEAQVSRLQEAYNAALGDVEWLVPYDQINWEENHREYGLLPGDLDPVGGSDDLPR